jgi:hypothetical protein
VKLQTNENFVERGGVVLESAFRIKTTGKAFDILSSGLYTDPKLAIIRELSCNAYDAHVAAKNVDTPFEIHLPNPLEPYLSIKDFGTGLTEEEILGKLIQVIGRDGEVVEQREGGLYTTYFESTKADSNDFIGALGLGSKSPFSYTKSFDVYSRQNGKKKTYCAYVNETGVPTAALMGVCDTDEHNGLEVRITVRPEDFYSFQEKTAQALKWFPVRPIITGNHDFEWPEIPECKLEGEGWKIFQFGFSGDYSRMTAIQGNVAYKVDISKLNLSHIDQKILETMHIVGFFKIGELDVAANREEIRYDDRTVKNILDKIAVVRDGVLLSIENIVSEITPNTTWNIFAQLNKISRELFGDRTTFRIFAKNSKHPVIQQFITMSGCLTISRCVGHDISGYEPSNKSYQSSIKTKNVGDAFQPESRAVFFYNDLPVGGVARVKQWLRDQPLDSDGKYPMAYIIKPKKDAFDNIYKEGTLGTSGVQIIGTRPWTEQDYVTELARIRTELGDVNFKVVSQDTPKIEREKVERKTDLPIYRCAGSRGRYQRSVVWQKVTDYDLTKLTLWFPLENGSHICFYNKDGSLCRVSWAAKDARDFFEMAVKLINDHLKLDFTEVYGVGSQAVKKVKKSQQWVNLFDALVQVMPLYKAQHEFYERIQQTPDDHGIKQACLGRSNSKFHTLLKTLSPSSVFRTKCEEIITDYRASTTPKLQEIIRFLKRVDLDMGTKIFDTSKGVVPYFARREFVKTYPMLMFVNIHDEYSTTHDIQVVFDYISTIDRS